MKIDCPKQIGPSLDKVDQGRQPADMNRQTGRSEERIMQYPIQIECFGVVAGHVSVAQNKVHIVDGVDPAEHGTQLPQPVGVPFFGGCSWFGAADQPGDLAWIKLFKRF